MVDHFAEIVDKEKIVEDMVVGMTMGRVVGRFDSHKHVLANLEKVGFDFAEEAKFAKAQEHYMNFEQDIDNFENCCVGF